MASLLALVGCAATPPDTRSGNPEITVAGVDAECVRNSFLNGLVNEGYAILASSAHQIVAGRETRNKAAAFWLRTAFGGAPEDRLTLLLLPQPTRNSLRIVLTGAFVSNQGTGFERVHPIPAAQDDQDMLVAMKPRIENKCQVTG